MGKLQIQAKDISDVIEQYNPFAFKDAKNRIMIFKTYREAYFELLERIYKAGPLMVDAVVFCVDNFGMEFRDAVRFVNLWYSVTGRRDHEYLFNWTVPAEAEQMAERFAKGMHTISETKFNKDLFKAAFDSFISTRKLLR